MPKIIDKSTLEYYNYYEENNFKPEDFPSYSVKVSDKDGNIITLEKDGALFALVGLTLDSDTGTLSLIDKAHEDSVLAEIEMPDADYIYNCRFDETKNAILFDVKSLYGDETSTIELDVASLVEIYEAGNGIEIGDKDETTGRRPISIKLAEGENILQVSESGLSLSDEVTTDEELEAAISGKANTDEVNEKFTEIDGNITEINDKINNLSDIIGTDIDDPSLSERIDLKADLEDLNGLEEEVGDLEVSISAMSDSINTMSDKIDEFQEGFDEVMDDIANLNSGFTELSGSVDSLGNLVSDINDSVTDLEITVDNNKTEIVKVTSGLSSNVKEAYELHNKLGETLGERILIYKDSSIENIEYVTEDDKGHHGQFIKVTYINSDGEREYSYIDLSEVIINAEFKDGFEVVDGKVYIKINPNSDSFLSVDEDGLKLSGIQQKLDELLNADSQLLTLINNEVSARTDADNSLSAAIANEASLREQGDSSLQSLIELETENRTNADAELQNAIDSEASARESADEAIANSIDEKVNAEKARAELAETNLSNAISAETSNREQQYSALSGKIDTEIQDRENADTAIRQDIGEDIDDISVRIDGIESDLSEETSERIREDNEIKDEIGTFRDLYAKKEYVDSKDLEMAVSAVTSATTLANEYSDLKNDYLRQELKLYCDTGHTELQNEISENATKINIISNLKGVTGTDISNYDDSGNGILDVLHREFHEHIETIDGRFEFLENKIDDEILRATEEEENINNRIDNLVIDCGIY